MSAHHEVTAQAPRRTPDPREPENFSPPTPLKVESKGSGKPPSEPPVVVAPATPDPFDLPYGGA